MSFGSTLTSWPRSRRSSARRAPDGFLLRMIPWSVTPPRACPGEAPQLGAPMPWSVAPSRACLGGATRPPIPWVGGSADVANMLLIAAALRASRDRAVSSSSLAACRSCAALSAWLCAAPSRASPVCAPSSVRTIFFRSVYMLRTISVRDSALAVAFCALALDRSVVASRVLWRCCRLSCTSSLVRRAKGVATRA